MQTPDPIRRDLPPDLEPEEREPLVGLGARLQARRPTPAAAFRGELRDELLGAPAGRRRSTRAGRGGQDRRRPGERVSRRQVGGKAARGAPAPARPLALAASYAAAGALLLAVAAAGLEDKVDIRLLALVVVQPSGCFGPLEMLDQLARHEVLQRLPGDLVVLANPPLVGAKQLGKQACVDQIDLWRSAIGQLVAIQMDNLMGAIG